MEKVYLKAPSMEHKDAYNEMMTEWEEAGGRIFPGIIRRNGNDYSSWLNMLEEYKHRETCPANLVPGDAYFLVNEDSKLLGAISIRHYLSEQLFNFGGHIGYGIRPSERRKGYASEMLKLALEKCRELGIDKVLVTCDKDNIASARTIMANNGVLENELAEEDGNLVQRYWIDL